MQPEVYFAVAGFIGAKLTDYFFDKYKDYGKAIQENTLAITELKVQISHLSEMLKEVKQGK